MAMKIIGHRGAAAEAPENTLAGLQQAFASGADGVEVDVRLSLDNELVVFHDATTERLCQVNWTVATAHWRELSKVRVGGEPIPRLDAVLNAVPEGKVALIELKPQDPVRLLSALKTWHTRQASVIAKREVIGMSFDRAILHALAMELPEWPRWQLVADPNALDPGLPVQGYGLNAAATWETSTLATLADQGRQLSVWTENEPSRLADWQALGIGYLTTDVPSRMVPAHKRLQSDA